MSYLIPWAFTYLFINEKYSEFIVSKTESWKEFCIFFSAVTYKLKQTFQFL